MIDAVFPQDMLQAVPKDSAEIDNAGANLQSVYEITGAAARTEGRHIMALFTRRNSHLRKEYAT